MPPAVALRFGPFEARLIERQLLVEGRPANLGSRAFELLVALLERRDRVVGRNELIDIVWPGLVVEDNNLTVQISHLRKVIGREAIVSLPGQGYRFCEAVTAVSSRQAGASARATSRLPRMLASLVGRERELADLRRLMGDARLLTLCGVGGIGKTRLALALADERAAQHPDDVYFVDLAPVSEPRRLEEVVAQALGAEQLLGRSAIDRVCALAQSRRLFMVLDNCEHVLDDCRTFAERFLDASPLSQLLTTSREALHLRGEQVYQVPVLGVPDPSAALPEIERSAAVSLLVQRARLHRSHFELTPDNSAAVAALCVHLDGLPLALELAAARLRMLSADQIVERLDDRFRLLVDVSRDAPMRHRALHLALDWSHNLLSREEQTLFASLAVFSGGWGLDAAEQVCQRAGIDRWAVLDGLAALVDKSLARVENDHGTPRYSMLETVRHYAAQKLASCDDGGAGVRDLHLRWFAAFAEEAEDHLAGPDQASWIVRLDADRENIRAALGHASSNDEHQEAGLRLASALRHYWIDRGLTSEGRRWLAALLETRTATTEERWHAKALNAAGTLAWTHGDAAKAESLLQSALAMRRRLGEGLAIAGTLNNLGNVSLGRHDFPAASTLYEESLGIYRELGESSRSSPVLSNLAIVASEQGDTTRAIDLLEQSLAIDRARGDRHAIAMRLNNLGVQAEIRAEWVRARAYYTESLALRRELDDRWGIASSLGCLANVALEQGDLAASGALRRESLDIVREMDQERAFALAFEGRANLAVAEFDVLRAARLWGGAEQLREQIGLPMPAGWRRRHETWLEAARAQLSALTPFDRAWALGRTLTLEQLIADAMTAPAEEAGTS